MTAIRVHHGIFPDRGANVTQMLEEGDQTTTMDPVLPLEVYGSHEAPRNQRNSMWICSLLLQKRQEWLASSFLPSLQRSHCHGESVALDIHSL